MKRFLTIAVCIVCFCLLFVACSKRVTESTFTVKFETNGGSKLDDIVSDRLDTSPEPTLDGFVFDGWYESKDFASPRLTFPFILQKDITLYAKYIDLLMGNTELTYALNASGDGYEVLSFDSSSQNLVIPKMHNGLPVKTATDGFLKNYYYLQSVYFFSVLENIDETFYYCSRLLRFVQMDENRAFTVIDDALYGEEGKTLLCYPVAKEPENGVLTLPVATTKVEQSALRNCAKIKKLVINDALVALNGKFSSMTSLTAFEATHKNTAFSSPGGVLFDKNGEILLSFPVAHNAKSYQLPNGTKSIAVDAFEKTKLTTLKLNSELERFENVGTMTELTEIIADGENFCDENGVLYRADFSECVRYPSAREGAQYRVKEETAVIGMHVFSDVRHLTEVILPKGVKAVKSFAFSATGTSSIENITFEKDSQLDKLEANAFLNATKLKSLTLRVRRPPNIDLAELESYSFKIFVPVNLIGYYSEVWGYISEKLTPLSEVVTTYELRFESNGGSTIDDRTVVYLSEEPIPVKKGYAFGGWYDNAETKGKRIEFPYLLEFGLTLYADWIPIEIA